MRREMSPTTDFGYFFEEQPHPGLHGHRRLMVHLYDQPTYEHFDPEQIEFMAKVRTGSHAGLQLDEVCLTYPWTGAQTYEVCCGHIFITDRKGKKIDAFTFGGNVHLHTENGVTMVVFESSIPIFEVTHVNPVIDLFVDEVEILLAMRRAEWLKAMPHLHTYEERLCLAEPVALYVACVLDVEQRLARVYDGASENQIRLRSAIRAELQWLRQTGSWLGELKHLAGVV